MLLGALNAPECFLNASPYLCLDTILARMSTDNSLNLIDLFLL